MQPSSRRLHLVALALALVISFLITFVRFRSGEIKLPPQPSKVRIATTLSTEPKISGSTQSFKVDQITIKTGAFPQYHYGDNLIIVGTLSQNRISFPQINRISSESARTSPVRFFVGLRGFLIGKIKSFLPEPQASLVSGIVLGQEALSPALTSDLRKSGLIHIVVVSGQNISILAGFILSFSAYIGRRKAMVVSIIFVIFYAGLTGANPPVVRAAIMTLLSFAGIFLGRQIWSVWILTLTAYLMVTLDPRLLVDISFQLSFAATLGVLTVGKKIENLLRRLPAAVRGDLSTSLGAYLLTVPISLYHFGQLSSVAPITNLLVVWTVAPLLILGFAIVTVGVLIPILGQLVAFLAWIPATFFITVAQGSARLPFASLHFGKGSWLVAAGYFALLALWYFSKKRQDD